MHAYEHTQRLETVVAGLTQATDPGVTRGSAAPRSGGFPDPLQHTGTYVRDATGATIEQTVATAHRARLDRGRTDQVGGGVGPAGRVVPAAYREALGIVEGDTVVMRIEGDELHLISDATEVRRVREMIARYVPEGVSLVDELLRERRREVAADASE